MAFKKARALVTGEADPGLHYLDSQEMQLLLQKEYQSYVKNQYGFIVSTSLFYISETYPQYVIDMQ